MPRLKPVSVFLFLMGLMMVTGAPALATGASATLTIEVINVGEARGEIHFALYDGPENFPKRTGRLRKGKVKAAAPRTRILLNDLKPGDYAVAIFHDANSNGEFDQGIFGIPLEDYGFSNDASGFFGAPSYEAAKFALGRDGAVINVTLGR